MTATLHPAPPTAPAATATTAATAAVRPTRARRVVDLLLLLGALPFVLVGLARATSFAEGDTYWQIATGAEILTRGTTALVEDDSWTAAGTPWHPNSWLYDVLVERAWVLAGWTGLGWFTLVTVGGVGIAVAVVGRALGATAVSVAVVSAATAIPLVGWFSARPQTLSYVLSVLLLLLGTRVALGHGRRSLVGGTVALTALAALWVNLHLAALAGVAALAGGAALTVVVGLVADLRHGRGPLAGLARAGRSAVVVAAAAVGSLASPLGIGILGSATHTADASVDLITEWAPLWRAESTVVLTWTAAAGALAVLVTAWWRGARTAAAPAWLPFWTGAVATLLLAGVTAGRFAPMALVLAVPAVAAVLPALRPARLPWLLHRLALGLPIAVGAAVLWVAVTDLGSFGRPGPLFPDTATVAALPDGCRVLNEYNDGGLITLLRRADGVLVSVDGRNDVYGTERILATDALLTGGAGSLAALDQAGVGCLLLDPDRPLVARAEAAGWRVTARDDARVLLVAP